MDTLRIAERNAWVWTVHQFGERRVSEDRLDAFHSDIQFLVQRTKPLSVAGQFQWARVNSANCQHGSSAFDGFSLATLVEIRSSIAPHCLIRRLNRRQSATLFDGLVQ